MLMIYAVNCRVKDLECILQFSINVGSSIFGSESMLAEELSSETCQGVPDNNFTTVAGPTEICPPELNENKVSVVQDVNTKQVNIKQDSVGCSTPQTDRQRPKRSRSSSSTTKEKPHHSHHVDDTGRKSSRTLESDSGAHERLIDRHSKTGERHDKFDLRRKLQSSRSPNVLRSGRSEKTLKIRQSDEDEAHHHRPASKHHHSRYSSSPPRCHKLIDNGARSRGVERSPLRSRRRSSRTREGQRRRRQSLSPRERERSQRHLPHPRGSAERYRDNRRPRHSSRSLHEKSEYGSPIALKSSNDVDDDTCSTISHCTLGSLDDACVRVCDFDESYVSDAPQDDTISLEDGEIRDDLSDSALCADEDASSCTGTGDRSSSHSPSHAHKVVLSPRDATASAAGVGAANTPVISTKICHTASQGNCISVTSTHQPAHGSPRSCDSAAIHADNGTIKLLDYESPCDDSRSPKGTADSHIESEMDKSPDTPQHTVQGFCVESEMNKSSGMPQHTAHEMDRSPGTPQHIAQGSREINKSPGTPQHTAREIDRSPGTPQHTAREMDRSPGTPQHTACEMDRSPGTPQHSAQESREMDRSPGTPQHTAREMDRSPGTPQHTAREMDRSPGTPQHTAQGSRVDSEVDSTAPHGSHVDSEMDSTAPHGSHVDSEMDSTAPHGSHVDSEMDSTAPHGSHADSIHGSHTDSDMDNSQHTLLGSPIDSEMDSTAPHGSHTDSDMDNSQHTLLGSPIDSEMDSTAPHGSHTDSDMDNSQHTLLGSPIDSEMQSPPLMGSFDPPSLEPHSDNKTHHPTPLESHMTSETSPGTPQLTSLDQAGLLWYPVTSDLAVVGSQWDEPDLPQPELNPQWDDRFPGTSEVRSHWDKVDPCWHGKSPGTPDLAALQSHWDRPPKVEMESITSKSPGTPELAALCDISLEPVHSDKSSQFMPFDLHCSDSLLDALGSISSKELDCNFPAGAITSDLAHCSPDHSTLEHSLELTLQPNTPVLTTNFAGAFEPILHEPHTPSSHASGKTGTFQPTISTADIPEVRTPKSVSMSNTDITEPCKSVAGKLGVTPELAVLSTSVSTPATPTSVDAEPACLLCDHREASVEAMSSSEVEVVELMVGGEGKEAEGEEKGDPEEIEETQELETECSDELEEGEVTDSSEDGATLPTEDSSVVYLDDLTNLIDTEGWERELEAITRVNGSKKPLPANQTRKHSCDESSDSNDGRADERHASARSRHSHGEQTIHHSTNSSTHSVRTRTHSRHHSYDKKTTQSVHSRLGVRAEGHKQARGRCGPEMLTRRHAHGDERSSRSSRRGDRSRSPHHHHHHHSKTAQSARLHTQRPQLRTKNCHS